MKFVEEQLALMRIETGCEQQTVRVCGRAFTAESLARVETRDRMRRPGIKIDSDEELMEVRRMVRRD